LVGKCFLLLELPLSKGAAGLSALTFLEAAALMPTSQAGQRNHVSSKRSRTCFKPEVP
jgi:hypothetical protein